MWEFKDNQQWPNCSPFKVYGGFAIDFQYIYRMHMLEVNSNEKTSPPPSVLQTASFCSQLWSSFFHVSSITFSNRKVINIQPYWIFLLMQFGSWKWGRQTSTINPEKNQQTLWSPSAANHIYCLIGVFFRVLLQHSLQTLLVSGKRQDGFKECLPCWAKRVGKGLDWCYCSSGTTEIKILSDD